MTSSLDARGASLGISLALLLGCGDTPKDAGPVGGAGGSVGSGGAAGGVGAGGSGPVACADRQATLSFGVTPDVAEISGTVVRKTAAAHGGEDVTFADAAGVEYVLAWRAPVPAPLAPGDRIGVKNAKLKSFRHYRTLEIRRDGEPVLYATDIEQPSLPPPLRLEPGELACAAVPSDLIHHHRLVAFDGEQPIGIDVGQQARVGRFRVYNDLVVRHVGQVDDAFESMSVAVVPEP